MQARWLYRPPTWHPRPRRWLPLTKVVPGTIPLASAGYELGDGSDPATMSVLASTACDVAVYPAAQWPLSAPLVTVNGGSTDASGRLANITDAALVIGVTYRVVISRVSDRAAWVTEVTAT